MKVRLSISVTISRDRDEPVTVDLVGTHHEIPAATFDAGFQPPTEDDR